MTEHPDPLRDLGAFIREQRAGARLSLRRLSELAGISNPYLSQIERGLRRPSAEILQQIARGLRISAETLYVQAGILDERARSGDLADAILAEPRLGDEQKQTLLHIYRSFLQSNEDRDPPAPATMAPATTDSAPSATAGPDGGSRRDVAARRSLASPRRTRRTAPGAEPTARAALSASSSGAGETDTPSTGRPAPA